MCMFACYPMLWQDTAWYILTIRQKMEFVFRINHVLKILILKILKIYFKFMDYYNTFQKKER